MTPATLRNHTCKDLAQMAKKHGVPGWHSMRKDQLVQALAKQAKQSARSKSHRSSAAKTRSNGAPRNGNLSSKKRSATRKPAKPASPRVRARINQLHAKLERAKSLAGAAASGDGAPAARDRLVVMVRDSYWLHAYWELTFQTVGRVKAAMGQHWHTARPMLRLFVVNNHGTATSSETLVRSVEIHGGVNNWYVDVKDPAKNYRMDIGYQASGGEFNIVARSNVVTPPPPAVRDTLDENWTEVVENYDRIFAMSGGYSAEGGSQEVQELLEERLRRPMGSPATTRYGSGATSVLGRPSEFHFEADAELIVYGASQPDAHVTLKGEPVRLRPDGTFTVRLNLPDRRQVVPVVASSSDGVEQRTIVIAVERNTKRMEPVFHDKTQ